MNNKSFLGNGMKFPPQINKSTGRFMTSDSEQNVKESIYLILMTMQGERWLVPSFGSRLMNYTFMDKSITMYNIMMSELRSTILNQEPRVSDVNIDIDDQTKQDCLIITISYRIIAENKSDNLVFPFYINAQSGE